MTIREINLHNFRIYYGDNPIDLQTEGRKNINIISGKNGYGKTTFLMSLVWCLYGNKMQEVDDLYKKEITDQGGYSKYISSSLNRLAKFQGDYNFFVSVTFTNINIPEVLCKELTIKRSYNLKTSVTESLDILIDGHQSELAKEVGNEIFIREFIMPIEIAKFFFFDAEKIVNLADVTTSEQRKKLSRAYSEVLGIKKYEDIKLRLEELQLYVRQESASATEKNQLEQLKADVNKFNNLISENENKIYELRESKSEKAKESRDIQEKLIKSGSFITVDELEALRQQEIDYGIRLSELQNMLKVSYEIIPFAIAGETLLEVKKQLDNEANYKSAQYKNENVNGVTNKILTDLLTFPRPEKLFIEYQVQKFYADAFETLIRKHFFEDTPVLPADFKLIHEFSDTEKNELQATISNIRLSFKESFKRINAEFAQLKADLFSVKKRIRDAEANKEDPIIEEYRNKKDAIDNELLRIDSTIDSLNREIGNYENEKTQKEKRIEELSRKLNVSAKNKAKDELLSRNINNLKEFITKFKEQKKASLENQILTGLEQLMHKKGFIKKVEVEIIGEDIDIILKNGRGEEIKKESLSKGEQQLYATALLRALVEESDIQFPVFIDSPMQKFDEDHAENIVKYFYPFISDQVIILPLITGELTDERYSLLLQYISKTYLIKNVDSEKSEFIPVSPLEFIPTYKNMQLHVN